VIFTKSKDPGRKKNLLWLGQAELLGLANPSFSPIYGIHRADELQWQQLEEQDASAFHCVW
jgi:hypothetical protein